MAGITKRSVDALRPSKIKTKSGNPSDAYLWDSEIPGFGCKCTPAGKRVFLFQYRNSAGRTRRVTIGTFGPMTPEQARGAAKLLYGAVASGGDPASERDKRKDALTFGQVRERFIAEHVSNLSETSQLDYGQQLNVHITGTLASRPIADIRRADMSKLHHELKSTPIAANRLVAVLSKLFSWCEEQELRPEGSNPCRHVERYEETPRERYLNTAELQALGKALAEAKQNSVAIAAIRLLLFTGARRSEILGLRWEWIDFERNVARLPAKAHKSGRKTGKGKDIVLSAPALAVLETLTRIKGNPFVLPGNKDGEHLVNLSKPWGVIRKAAKLQDVRLHDLRHSFASVGAMSGASLPIIGKLLGHSQSATTERYAHLEGSPIAEAGKAIANRISAELDAGAHRKDGDNVVPIKGTGAA